MKKKLLKELLKKEAIKVIQEVRNKRKRTLEGISIDSIGLAEKDDVGRFYVVTSPTKETSENIMFETDLFNFAEKIQKGQLKYENIKGIYKNPTSAKRLKERLIRERKSAINDAKQSAERLKGLRDEVKQKAEDLKKTQIETKDKLNKIK